MKSTNRLHLAELVFGFDVLPTLALVFEARASSVAFVPVGVIAPLLRICLRVSIQNLLVSTPY